MHGGRRQADHQVTNWTKINESAEELRLHTSRMKVNRIKLPHPGTLVSVKHFVILSIVEPAAFRVVVEHTRGELLLLVYVNTQPPLHPNFLIDPVELVFMSMKRMGGALVTTGTRAAADVMDPYEVL